MDSSAAVSRSISRHGSCCGSADEAESSTLHSRRHSDDYPSSPPFGTEDDAFILSHPSKFDSIFPHADLPAPSLKKKGACGSKSNSAGASKCCSSSNEIHLSLSYPKPSPHAELELTPSPTYGGEPNGHCCSHSPPPTISRPLPEGIQPVPQSWFSAPGLTSERNQPFDLAGFDLEGLESLGIDISAILSPSANHSGLFASPVLRNNELEAQPTPWHVTGSMAPSAIIEEEGAEDDMSPSNRDAGQWNSTSLLRTAAPDPIEPFFKTVGERNLVCGLVFV